MKDNKKMKRIGAWIGLVLIAAMLILTLFAAIFATEHAPGLFLASIFSVIVIPIMYYVFVTVYKFVHRHDTIDTNDKNNQ